MVIQQLQLQYKCDNKKQYKTIYKIKQISYNKDIKTIRRIWQMID